MKTEHKKHKDKADAVHNNKDMDQLRAQREDAFACGSFGLMQVYLRSLMNWCSYNICHGVILMAMEMSNCPKWVVLSNSFSFWIFVRLTHTNV